jgi:glycosyltransferase involved in cell wall biosynthesis
MARWAQGIRVRVALLCETFSRKMGYLQRALPKYLARLGAEVHVITMDLPPYYHLGDFKQTYGEFSSGEELLAGSIESFEGYTLHVLHHRKVFGHMRMAGLGRKLRSIRPDVVQTTVNFGWLAMDAALYKPFLGYALFTGNHYHASVFPLARKQTSPWNAERWRCRVARGFPGWLVSLCSEKCYAITSDCAEVVTRFFGVPEDKVEVSPLGFDKDLFYPVANSEHCQARSKLRQRLGFKDSETVCIYTGRFTEDKNPLLLARAIADCAGRAKSFRGLFVGNGAQAEAIQACAGCITHAFVPVDELGDFYRAADIGVWPTQESMSMLDAAACGLPIVANNTMTAPERIEGNGLAYELNDIADLIRVLQALEDPGTRQRMGRLGAQKMARDFSWESIANRRLRDYQLALGLRRPATTAVSKEWMGRD